MEQNEVQKLCRKYNLLEQARQDVPGHYSTSFANEKSKDEAAQHKFSITESLSTIKDKLIRKGKKLIRASEKAASINPSIVKLLDWLKITELKLQRCVPLQLTTVNFAAALDQCNVSTVLYKLISVLSLK